MPICRRYPGPLVMCVFSPRSGSRFFKVRRIDWIETRPKNVKGQSCPFFSYFGLLGERYLVCAVCTQRRKQGDCAKLEMQELSMQGLRSLSVQKSSHAWAFSKASPPLNSWGVNILRYIMPKPPPDRPAMRWFPRPIITRLLGIGPAQIIIAYIYGFYTYINPPHQFHCVGTIAGIQVCITDEII